MDNQVNPLALASVYSDAALLIIKSQEAVKSAHGSLWNGYATAGKAAISAKHGSKVMKDSLRLAISASGGELSQGTYNRYSPVLSAIVDAIQANEIGEDALNLTFAECDKLVKGWRQATKEQSKQPPMGSEQPSTDVSEQPSTDERAYLLSRLATITSSLSDEHLQTFVDFCELLSQMSHEDLLISLNENMGE